METFTGYKNYIKYIKKKLKLVPFYSRSFFIQFSFIRYSISHLYQLLKNSLLNGGTQLNTITSKMIASRGAGVHVCDCKRDQLQVRCSLEEIKQLFKLILLFLRSGDEVKRGVQFCHSTRNAFRFRRIMRNGMSKHLFPSAYSAVCGIQRGADTQNEWG